MLHMKRGKSKDLKFTPVCGLDDGVQFRGEQLL